MGDVSASLLNHLCAAQASELKLFIEDNQILNMLSDSFLVLYQIQNSNNPGTFSNIQNCIQYQQKEQFYKQQKQKDQENDQFINRERIDSIELNMSKDQKIQTELPLKDLSLMIKDKDKEEFQSILRDNIKFSTEQFAQNVFEFGGIEPHFNKVKDAYQNSVQLDKGPYSIKEGFLIEVYNDKKKIDYSKENVIDLTDETVLKKINEQKMGDISNLRDDQGKDMRNNRQFDNNNKYQEQVHKSQKGYKQDPIIIDGGKTYQNHSNKNIDNYQQRSNYNSSSSSSPPKRKSYERKVQKDYFQEKSNGRQEEKYKKSPVYAPQNNNYNKDRENSNFSDEDDYTSYRSQKYSLNQKQFNEQNQKQNQVQYNSKYFPGKQPYNNKFNRDKDSHSFRKQSPERRRYRKRSMSREEKSTLRNRDNSYKKSQRSPSSYRSSRSSFSRDRDSESNDYYNRRNKYSPNQYRNYSPQNQHENEFQNKYNGNSYNHNQNYQYDSEKHTYVNNKNNSSVTNNFQNKNERGYNNHKNQSIEEPLESGSKYDNLNNRRSEMNIQQYNNHIKDNNNFNRGNNSQYQQNQNNQMQNRNNEFKNNNYKNNIYTNNELINNEYKMNYYHDSTEIINRQHVNPQNEQNNRMDDQNKQNLNGYYDQNIYINTVQKQNLDQKYNNFDTTKQVNVQILKETQNQQGQLQPTIQIPTQQPPPPPLPPSYPPPPQSQFIQISQNKIIPNLNYPQQSYLIQTPLMKTHSNYQENIIDNNMLPPMNHYNNQGPNILQRSISEQQIQNSNQYNNNQMFQINNYPQQLPSQIVLGKVQNPLLRTCSLLTNQGHTEQQNFKWQNN